ncbi:hypothetical protein VTI74DRAFT_7125 [Chaetomium olivicolor]
MTLASGSFAAATRLLSLAHDEVVAMVALADKERRKKLEVASVLSGGMSTLDLDVVDKAARDRALRPINDSITGADITRAKAFLRFLGHDEVASKLGWWQGSGGDYHEIPIDQDADEIVEAGELAGFIELRGDGPDQAASGSSSNESQVLDISGEEIMVRMDPPLGTLNPFRLRSGAGPSRAVSGQEKQVRAHKGLHPVNFVDKFTTGKEFAALGLSGWHGVQKANLSVNVVLGETGNSQASNQAATDRGIPNATTAPSPVDVPSSAPPSANLDSLADPSRAHAEQSQDEHQPFIGILSAGDF